MLPLFFAYSLLTNIPKAAGAQYGAAKSPYVRSIINNYNEPGYL
ncbi:hypothetical protein [Alteromonas sp. H39]